MPTHIWGIIAVTLVIGCSFKIGEAIGVCIGDQIKCRYVLWRDKRNKDE
ncbi:hypothetical protein [Gallibacterium salpingitidis]|nr:hypothetical protein [Gallibacterium salpingitidis]